MFGEDGEREAELNLPEVGEVKSDDWDVITLVQSRFFVAFGANSVKT